MSEVTSPRRIAHLVRPSRTSGLRPEVSEELLVDLMPHCSVSPSILGALIGGVDYVDPARSLPEHYKEAARLALVPVTGAASVPTEVVQLVLRVRHRGTVDYLRVGR